MVLRPDSRGLCAAREQIRRVAKGLHIPPDEADYLLIAVGEAVSNAFRHGTPDPSRNLIRLSWHHGVDALVVMIKDDGDGFDANSTSSGSERFGATARGIELMRACADEVYLLTEGGGKVVLHKRVRPVSAASPTRIE